MSSQPPHDPEMAPNVYRRLDAITNARTDFIKLRSALSELLSVCQDYPLAAAIWSQSIGAWVCPLLWDTDPEILLTSLSILLSAGVKISDKDKAQIRFLSKSASPSIRSAALAALTETNRTRC